MALRTCTRRLGAAASPLRGSGGRCTLDSTSTSTIKRRTVANATASSNLPKDYKQTIEREASLSNPDPPSDSQTAQIVHEHLSYMVPTYVRPMPMFAKGKGCHLWDVENRRYLDFTAGIAVNALGHCDEGVTQVLAAQADTLMHTSNLYHNPWTGALSALLVEKTRQAGGMRGAARAFVCNSGSEANEAAIKFARKVGKVADPAGGKTHVLSFEKSFHGRTMGALSATPNPKYQKPFGPMIPGFVYGNLNDVAAVPELVTQETCGVIVEPIQGEGGINVASVEFLTALRARCDEVGAVLIYDEIQCGLSRTGRLWAHANLPEAAHPDIITTAKALGNGYPVGATIVTEDVSSKIATGDHGTTFGGNPLASRLAHYIVNRLTEPQLQEGVLRKEQIFRSHFERLRQRFPSVVTEVRGEGLILGLQLNQDPVPIITAARERGLLIINCGTNTLRFVPPLVIEDQEINEGMSILEAAMEATVGSGS